jgi:hypothetical protein
MSSLIVPEDDPFFYDLEFGPPVQCRWQGMLYRGRLMKWENREDGMRWGLINPGIGGSLFWVSENMIEYLPPVTLRPTQKVLQENAQNPRKYDILTE